MADTEEQPTVTVPARAPAPRQSLHPLGLRIMHWINAVAIIVMIGSGLKIYGDSPIFGWLAFLLFRGLFARSGRQIVLALVLLLLYGSVLWGVLPGTPGVSWQAHLFGALSGVLAARLVASADRRSGAARPPRGQVSPSPTGP